MQFSPFWLLVWSFIGIVMIFFNPFNTLTKRWRGMSREDAKEDAKNFFAQWETSPGTIIGKSCSFTLFMVLLTLVTFIVEPYYIVYAISSKFGNQYFAYLVGAITLYRWTYSFGSTIISRLKEKKKSPVSNLVVVSQSGKPVQSELLATDNEPMIKTKPIVRWTYRILYSIPRLYLVYLFIETLNLR